MRTQNISLFANFSMTEDGYSDAFNLEMVTSYSIQAVWTGSPVGYLFLQVSNDISFNNAEPTNWILIERSIIPTDDGDFNHLWKQYMAPFKWIRLGYAFGSGTGTLNARLNCKGHD
jgi:hypothetical protein